MKDTFLVLILSLFCILTFSCAPSLVPKSARSSQVEASALAYTRAQAVYREGRFTEAAKMLGGEKKFAPALVLRGKAEYLSGDVASAGISLKKALALKPHDVDALLFLARVCRENGTPGEAQKLADKILGDNPHEIRALRFAADLARERGVSGEAAAAALLDKAVETLSEASLVFLDRARLRWTGGNSAGALEDLSRAKALLPEHSPVLRGIESFEAIIREVSK